MSELIRNRDIQFHEDKRNNKFMNLPAEWDVQNLNEVSTLKGRIGWQGLKQSEFTMDTSMPFLITGMNFKDGEIRWEEVYHVSYDRYMVAKEIQLKNGDVLMTKDGTIGKLLYVNSIPKPGMATLNSHLLLFRPKNNKYFPKYLYYQLNSTYFKKHIENTKSGSTFFGISQESVGKFKVILPPLKEQKAIAKALSDVDELIESLEQLIEKKKAIKKGVMQELLTGKKRLPGFDGEWVEKTLGDIGEVKMCKRIFNEETSINGDIPFYKIGTFGKKPDAYISEEKYNEFRKKYSFPNVGEILISAAGTIGRTVIYKGEDAYFQDSNIVWIENDQKLIKNNFLYYILKIIQYQTEGGTIQRLYNSILRNARFLCPPLSEQEAITKILNNIDEELNVLVLKVEKYRNIKQGMMQELLTGKTRLI